MLPEISPFSNRPNAHCIPDGQRQNSPREQPMDWRRGQENADLTDIKNTYCASSQICDGLPDELKSRMGLLMPYTCTTVPCVPMIYTGEAETTLDFEDDE